MEKEKLKSFVCSIGNKFVKVTEDTPEIYKITLIFVEDESGEIFYRSFRDEDDVRRYCMRYSEIFDFIRVSYEFVDKFNFGGNVNE